MIDELATRLVHAGRNNGPALLLDWWWDGVIGEEELRSLLCGVWSGCEWPAQAAEEDTWLDWFDSAGFVSDSGRDAPSEPLTVFRGASLEGGARGFSWTPSREVAHWFAAREVLFGRGPAGVWEAVIPPGYVLATIESVRPGEPEVIVDPRLFDTDEALRARYGLTAPRLVERVATESNPQLETER